MISMKMLGKVLCVIQLIASITYGYVLIGVTAQNSSVLDSLFPFSICHRMYLFLVDTLYIALPILVFTILWSVFLIFRDLKRVQKNLVCLFSVSISNILLLVVLVVFTNCAIQSLMGI